MFSTKTVAFACLSLSLSLIATSTSAETAVSPQVTLIDKHITQGWVDYELKPSATAPDGLWARRVYLDVIGRIPTNRELQEFTSDKSADRDRRLVQKLLYDDKYTEEYARNWATVWSKHSHRAIGR